MIFHIGKLGQGQPTLKCMWKENSVPLKKPEIMNLGASCIVAIEKEVSNCTDLWWEHLTLGEKRKVTLIFEREQMILALLSMECDQMILGKYTTSDFQALFAIQYYLILVACFLFLEIPDHTEMC